MTMMCVIGNCGAIALQLLNLPLLLIISRPVSLLLLRQLKAGIFWSSVVRIKLFSWTWWQCVAEMCLSQSLTIGHFSGKFQFRFSDFSLILDHCLRDIYSLAWILERSPLVTTLELLESNIDYDKLMSVCVCVWFKCNVQTGFYFSELFCSNVVRLTPFFAAWSSLPDHLVVMAL